MKQGSTDDPFAEDPFAGDATDEGDDGDVADEPSTERGATGEGAAVADPVDEQASDGKSHIAESPGDGSATVEPTAGGPIDGESADAPRSDASVTEATNDSETTVAENAADVRDADPGPAPQTRSLPYIHARDGVKDGRTQRPVFLRDHVESGIDDLVTEMEDELGEDVYKTDVTEAAMAVAQEHPELVLAKLQEWGYGWH